MFENDILCIIHTLFSLPGYWSDVQCDTDQKAFVCKKARPGYTTVTPPPTTVPAPGGCQPEFFLIGRDSYLLQLLVHFWLE